MLTKRNRNRRGCWVIIGELVWEDFKEKMALLLDFIIHERLDV